MPRPTIVFDTYWRFAAERQAIFFRRLWEPKGPWTKDTILRTYRFTNAYRVLDRVSQFLIREVQYRNDRPQTDAELGFRTLLFKIFNRIETWRELEREVGPIVWGKTDLHAIARVLDSMKESRRPIYSAAYIMPAPPLGHRSKHKNHLDLLTRMMCDRLPDRLSKARSLKAVYRTLLQYPGIGPFLAFQYTIDLNYSSLLSFDEAEFVVAGPGALDGISKCFEDTGNLTPEEIIYWTAEQQTAEFNRLGLSFEDLFGRPLQPIDCQNLYCELSKYARLAHPSFVGISGRKRIKQIFHPDTWLLPDLFFPPRWSIGRSRDLGL
jgi:alpha-glutamyl/putrescinyl thymine pyrophosphorylase clade 1